MMARMILQISLEECQLCWCGCGGRGGGAPATASFAPNWREGNVPCGERHLGLCEVLILVDWSDVAVDEND